MQTQAALGHYKDAEDHFSAIQSEEIKNEFSFYSWHCRTRMLSQYINETLLIAALTRWPVIFCGKPRVAWEMYLRMESTHESFVMLQILANDCYRAGHFFYSLKAFDVLERLDPAPEYENVVAKLF